MELFIGLITGFIFGFLLQKAEVLRFEKQVGFLLLKDMTIIKFMLSSILVGLVGIYLLRDLNLISLSVKGTVVGAQLIGGVLFGIGWAITGFCPGTSIGALAEGRIHAFWAILGMIAGAALYAEVYPVMKNTVLTWGTFGKITLSEVFNINHWVVIIIFILGFIALFSWFEKKKI